MKVFIVLCLIAIAYTTQVMGSRHLGEDRCTRGPSYWCKNVDTALECNMLTNCMEKYWILRPRESSSSCQTCARMIEEARKISVELLEKFILANCERLEDDSHIKKCKEISQTSGAVITNILKSTIDPSVACKVIGLCA